MAIGLDIGTSGIRVAEVESRRRARPKLSHYGELALPQGAVVEGDVVEPTAVADGLRELWDEARIKGRDVAVGIASQRVTVRELELPDLPHSELADAVRLQAQDQLPMPVDQALIDYVLVERSPAGDDRRNIRVLLVATEREMVERLLSAVTAAKLRPVLVDLDAFALLRSVATTAAGIDDTELIVDIGASVTKIAVHRAGNPLFVRMVRLGGDAATREIQRVLELSWEEAEAAKLHASSAMVAGSELDPDDERVRVLEGAVRRVVTEVRSSVDFFRSQHDEVEPQRIVVCGGASLAPGLLERLRATLELSVRQGDPLRAVDAGEARLERPDRDRGRFLAVPVGLALGLLP